MADILALYRGRTVTEAQLIAVTVEPSIVDQFLGELTGEADKPEESDEPVEREPLRVLPGDEE
jgi:hypothetical protein